MSPESPGAEVDRNGNIRAPRAESAGEPIEAKQSATTLTPETAGYDPGAEAQSAAVRASEARTNLDKITSGLSNAETRHGRTGVQMIGRDGVLRLPDRNQADGPAAPSEHSALYLIENVMRSPAVKDYWEWQRRSQLYRDPAGGDEPFRYKGMTPDGRVQLARSTPGTKYETVYTVKEADLQPYEPANSDAAQAKQRRGLRGVLRDFFRRR